MLLKVLLLILFFLQLNAQITTRTQVLMGTFVSVSMEDKKYFNSVFEIFSDVENSLSSYKKNALVYKLNKNRRVILDEYLYEALLLSKKFYKDTDGYFDIAIGSITKDLYSFGEDERVATYNELKKSNVKIDGVHFNKNIVYLDDGIKVDFGGIGKGYGVDKSAEFLKKNGIKKAIIAASGDIRCLGICKIDVNSPFSKAPLASSKTKNKNSAISTSGNYNRYVKSVKNNHLIDPKQKKSEQNFISITLIGDFPNSYLDAYATAASVMPPKDAYKFLDSINIGYIVLQSDKKLKTSSNIYRYVDDLVINYTVK